MKLFEKGKIGNMELKNRIVMPPMGTTADPDGGFSEQSVAYYEERAKGGVGLIITGYSAESETYERTTCTILDDFKKIGRLSRVIDACHAYGAKVCPQLGPGLGRIAYVDPQTPPWSASDDVSSFWFPDLKCRPLTKEDIAVIVKEVGYEAFIAKSAGADAVELRVYGGYLADQFMSTKWNHRTDEYGGSFENRMRFTVELIKSIQSNVGKDFPLLVKYNPYHGIEGGRDIEEGKEMAKLFEKLGVNALHLDKGCYEVWYNAITTVYQPAGHQLDMAAEIKKVVNIPVIVQGKLDDPVVAENALKDGKTDFTAIGHQLLADPHWANKIKEGKIKDIRPCIGCNECLRIFFSGKDLACTVNPNLAKEAKCLIEPAQEQKNILVIGGGPGGMEAALIASERGHKVTLWEQEDHLGGLMLAAGSPDFKYSVMNYLNYMVRQIDKSDVDVCLMTTADSDKIKNGNFDHVIIATGADSFIPTVKGIDKKHVHISTDILTGKTSLDVKTIAVIGGGLVGCETALYLAKEEKNVTVVEMLDDILATANHSVNNDLSLRHLLAEYNVDIRTKTKLVAAEDDHILVESSGESLKIDCDAIVIASGYKADHSLANELEGKVEYTIIGDNQSPRKIFDAVHEGFNISRQL